MHPLIRTKRQADSIRSGIPWPLGQVGVPPYIEAVQRTCEAIRKRVDIQLDAVLRSLGMTRAEWEEMAGTDPPLPAPAPLPVLESPRKSPKPARRAAPEAPAGIAPEPPPKADPYAVGFHAHDMALWHWKFRQEGVADNPAAADRHFWAWAGHLEPLAGPQGERDPGSVRKRLRGCWPSTPRVSR